MALQGAGAPMSCFFCQRTDSGSPLGNAVLVTLAKTYNPPLNAVADPIFYAPDAEGPEKTRARAEAYLRAMQQDGYGAFNVLAPPLGPTSARGQVQRTNTGTWLTLDVLVDVPRCQPCETLAKKDARNSLAWGVALGLLVSLVGFFAFGLAKQDVWFLFLLWLVSAPICWRILRKALSSKVSRRAAKYPRVVAFQERGWRVGNIDDGAYARNMPSTQRTFLK